MSFEETHNVPTTQTQETTAAEQPEVQPAEQPTAQAAVQPQPEPVAESAPQPVETPTAAAPRPEKEAGMEDFATALETFEQEQAQTEAALNEEQVVTGTVLKVTPQYVVVDIGYKSEGVIPVAELTDHEGNVTVQRGDEVAVMREPGHTEEGYIHLSHQKAQRLRSWDEIEKAFNEKTPVKARVIDRIKGGVTVDIMGARAFLPGSQVDLRPVRNLEAQGSGDRSPHHQAKQEARQHRGFAQATAGRGTG
jgi:small subunit ribosomal protein S1